MTDKFACPCCGFLTLREQPPGTFDVCPVCFWEDDAVQFDDTHYAGGANVVDLATARTNFKEFGASDQASVGNVRKPVPNEIPKPNSD